MDWGQTLRAWGDRRRALRVPVRVVCQEEQIARPLPSVALDLSEGGMQLRRVGGSPGAKDEAVGLELALPGTGELIWVHAITRFASVDKGVQRAGLRFSGMARRHERLLHDYLMDRRLRALQIAPQTWQTWADRLRALVGR